MYLRAPGTSGFPRAGAASLAAMLALALACDRGAPPPPVETSAPAPLPPPPDVAPPTPPRGLEATAASDGIEIHWTGSGDDRGVEGYEVLRGEERVARVSDRHVRDGDVRAGRQYCYTVVAFDAAGNRSEASEPACAVAVDSVAPSAPPSLQAKLAAPTELRLRWAPSEDDVGVTSYEVLRDDQVVATATEPTARILRLSPGREHCHVVRAVDAAGNRSAPSEPACITAPDVTAPSSPPHLAAKGGVGRVALSWSASDDDVRVTLYEVLRDGAVVGRVRDTAASETGLRTGQRYCYTVRALDAAGNASAAAGPACAAPPDLTPPTIPGGVVARAESDTAVTVGWAPATDDVGVARYEVIRGEAGVAQTAATGATIRGLRPAVEYCHAVRACDAAGNCSGLSRPACATTPDLKPPDRVANASARADSDRVITVTWSPPQDDVGVHEYQIRDGTRLVVIANGTAASFTDDGLLPATRHCYTIVAQDAAGNASKASESVCATTPDLVPPSAPPKLVAYARSSREIALTWQNAKDDVRVEGYEVVRDGEVVAVTDVTRALVGDLEPEKEYCVTVRALDPAQNRSPPSAKACARTANAAAPGAPWNVRAAATDRKELLLRWDPSPDPDVVYVVYWDGSRYGQRPVGTTPRDSFKVFGQAATERHCYRVVARNEQERESPSTIPLCASLHEVSKAETGEQAASGSGGGL